MNNYLNLITENYSILIVDNSYFDLHKCMKLFTKKGFQVTGASNIEEAIRKTENIRIDILIVEVFLKDNNFIQFIQSIRMNEVKNLSPKTFIIAYTEKWGKKQKNICSLAKIDMFFYKPIDIELIFSSIAIKNYEL